MFSSVWLHIGMCLLVTIDAKGMICGLFLCSLSASDQMTRPVLVEPCTPAVLEIQDGCHPTIIHTHSGGEYIPNDVSMESQHSCLLVTGPNMGGKSTLMRQTGLLVVLAQLVCLTHMAGCCGHIVLSWLSGLLCTSYKVQIESSG